MTDVTTLPGWPISPDTIDWSNDGIIAAATEEGVFLLVPHFRQNFLRDPTTWREKTLRTSYFTPEELPAKEAANGAIYSIGEEISSNSPILVSWSPPGVAKHRRCALGVLTSSLLLSVWAAREEPEAQGSWSRVLIVNNALKEYFSSTNFPSTTAEDADGEATSIGNELRLRTRIRSFAWAPALDDREPLGVMGTHKTWGQPIVAVSNQDGHVCFVAIDTPTSTVGKKDQWSARVLHHFAVVPEAESVPEDFDTFDELMEQESHMHYMTWSPWTSQDDRYLSVFVYATKGDLRARAVTYHNGTISLGEDEVIYHGFQVRNNGLMKWSPKVEEGTKVVLGLFTVSGITFLTISAADATLLAHKTHDLDGRSDETTGAAWDWTREAPSVHFASSETTWHYPTACLKVSEDNNFSEIEPPIWLEQISDSQALFSAQNDLSGNVTTRVWGLAASAVGDFIVASSTIHPSSLLEYAAPHKRNAILAINKIQSYGQKTAIDIPVQLSSSEGVAYTIGKWIESYGSSNATPDMIATAAENLAKKHWTSSFKISPDAHMDLPPPSPENLQQHIDTFKANVFFNQKIVEDRCHILATKICAVMSPYHLHRIMIAYRLAHAVTSLPPVYYQDLPFSYELREMHLHVIRLVEAVVLAENTEDEELCVRNPPMLEFCELCDARIPFDDIDFKATCLNGHTFPRCGLSFLAIQHPGITKHCGLCRTPFMNDGFVRAMALVSRRPDSTKDTHTQTSQPVTDIADGEVVAAEEKEPPVSLLRILFLACDACIYCGGKFTG